MFDVRMVAAQMSGAIVAAQLRVATQSILVTVISQKTFVILHFDGPVTLLSGGVN